MSLDATIQFALTPETADGALHEAAAYLNREITRAQVSNTAFFGLVALPSYAAGLLLAQDLVQALQGRRVAIFPSGVATSPIPLFYEFMQNQFMPGVQPGEAIVFKRAEDTPTAQWVALNQRLALFRTLPIRAIWLAPRDYLARLAQTAPELWAQATIVDLDGPLGLTTYRRTIEMMQGYTVNAIGRINQGRDPLDAENKLFLQETARDAETLLDEVDATCDDPAPSAADDPDWLRFPLHFLRGEIFATLQDHGHAVQEFELAADYAERCEHAPSLWQCRLELARALVAFYQPQVPDTLYRAANLLDEYLAQAPADSQALYTRGLVRWLRKQPRQALEDWDEAASTLPDSFDLHWMAGQAALRLHEADRAVTYLSRAHELKPTHPDCTSALSEAYRLAGRAQECDLLGEVELLRELLRDLLADVDLSGFAEEDSPPGLQNA